MDKKKILASLISATMLTTPQVKAEENYKLGDIDSNGTVSADDASMVLMEYARNSTGATPTFNDLQKKAADIDKNKKIDATDATMILKYYSYLSTGGKLSFEDYLNEDKKDTTPVTTSTTIQTTIPTTSTQTEPETRRDIMYEYMMRNDYTKYDLMSDDPLAARFALDKLSEQLNNELFKGSMSGIYTTHVLLSVLNYNQNLNKEALDYSYSHYDEESFKEASDKIDFAYNESLYETKVDFTKYVIDENFAELLNRVTDEYRDYNNNIYEPLLDEIENYFQNNSDTINNYAEYYFMYKTNEILYYKKYNTGDVQQMYFDNAVLPLYKSFKEKNTTPVTTSTTIQTTIPTTTVTTTQLIEKDNYTKYDLLDQNPAVAAKAFERLSDELWHELYNGYCFQSARGGITNGYYECKTFIATLNKDQNISLEALASDEALGSLSQEDFEFYSTAVAGLAGTEYDTGSTVDYTKYILNEELANYINNTNRAWKNYQNGDVDEYNSISDVFFDNIDMNDNYVKFFYMDLNENTSTGLVGDLNVEYAKDLFIENVSRPLYESYAPYKGHSYNR